MEIKSDNLNKDCNGAADTMENAAAEDKHNKNNVSNSCRLCLAEETTLQMDIFVKPQPNEKNNVQYCSLAERLSDLLHIKFENKTPLPHGICARCLLLFEAFEEFRDNVLKCENELQRRFNELQMKYTELAEIPGLNGNAGEFIVDTNSCEIIEVNVAQDYESSEDEFSLESDTETENNVSNTNNIQPVPLTTTNATTAAVINHNPLPTTAITKTQSYLCQYCDMAFTQQTDCHEHESTAHDKMFPYSCNFCQTTKHTSRQFIIAHIRKMHQPERPYICQVCTKGFCRRSDLKKHAIVHTGVRPYACATCGKSFSRNTNLVKHMRVHDSSLHTDAAHKNYQCDQCPAAYTRRDKLNVHKLTHSQLEGAAEINAHQPQKSILATHLLHQQPAASRAKSRSFTCDSCPKTFTREQDLQRHRALHLDHLFKCNACDIGFARREKLMLHIQQEHHTQVYTCHMCNLTFTQADALNMHMKVHQLQQFASYSAQSVNNHMNAAKTDLVPAKQLTTEEISFYSHMVPTMNLGFYSETTPEA